MNYEKIKKQENIVEVATNKLGLQLKQINSEEYRGYSLDGGNNNTCLSINGSKGVFHDFKTGVGGSVLDLVAYVNSGIITKETIYEAAKFLGYENESSPRFSNVAQNYFKTDVEVWHANLWKAQGILDYLHGRKITDETIKKYKIGLYEEPITIDGQSVKEWRLTFPYLDTFGNPFYMVSRCLDKYAHNDINGKPIKYHKLWLKNKRYAGYIHNGLFGLNTLRKNREILVIGEGIFDCLSFMQEGYTTLFSVGGFFSDEQLKSLLEIARTFNSVVLCYDSDESGKSFTRKLGKILFANDIEFTAINDYGKGNKDVSDYYVSGGNLEDLIKSSEDGYLVIAKSLRYDRPFRKMSKIARDELMSEARDFVMAVHDLLSKKEMSEIEKILGDYFPERKLEDLFDKGKRDNRINYIRDRYLKDHALISCGCKKSTTYYEYMPGGYWLSRKDADIEAAISKMMLHRESSRFINETLNRLRYMTNCPEEQVPEWNAKHIIAFKNGVLDLTTGELRAPREDDYLLGAPEDYEYDPTATCEIFDSLMKNWTQNAEDREATLDDMAGSILIPDCRYEKGLFLIGEEGSGKTTFLKAMTMLFNSGISYVMPQMLTKPTNRVLLEGSRLNIANDMKSDLGKAYDYLKKVISGEPIDGEHKFYENHKFIPHAKWFCTSNDSITASTIKGLRRRMVFVKFEQTIKEPDVLLVEKLKAERSGIFNRVYRAYKALLERGFIRECRDQEEMVRDFELNSDTVLAFWEHKKEEFSGTQWARSEVLKGYLNFCNDQRIQPESAHSFQKKFRAMLTKQGIIPTYDTWEAKVRTYKFAKLDLPGQEEQENEIEPKQPEKQEEKQEQPKYFRRHGESKEHYAKRVGIDEDLELYNQECNEDGTWDMYDGIIVHSPLEWVRWRATTHLDGMRKEDIEWLLDLLAKFEGMEIEAPEE